MPANPVPAETPPSIWTSVTNWTLARFTSGTAMGTTQTALVLGASIFAIGVLDYATGTRMTFVVFYLMPVALATAWTGRVGGMLAALASAVIRFVADTTDDSFVLHETWLWWNTTASIVVYLAVVWLLDALIRIHRGLERRVRERTFELELEIKKRQEVQRELVELSARERAAMGRELHDQLGQHLVGTAMAAQVLADRLGGPDAVGSREARNIADLVEQGIAQTRQLARGLLLSQIEPSRLATEIEDLCATLRQQFPHVESICCIGSTAQLRDSHVAAQIYRIAQEALRNAFRHGRATAVWISIEPRGAFLEVLIEDNGRGLPPPEERRGMGLRIMAHRAEHMGAQLTLTSRPSGGTRVACLVPLDAISPESNS